MTNLSDLSHEALLEECHCILTGEFFIALKSGQVANQYVDIDPLLTRPSYLDEIARRLSKLVTSSRIYPPQALACPAVGAIPLLYAFQRHFPPRQDTDQVVFAEKDGTDFAFKRRGFGELVAGKKVLVIEDITTTGQSAKKVGDQIIANGGVVCGYVFIWNRSPDTVNDTTMGATTLSLISNNIPAWPQDEHPSWGVWPLIENLGHPELVEKYPGERINF